MGPAEKVDEVYATLPRDYLSAHHDPARCDIADLFAERAADYRAVVERVSPGRACLLPSPASWPNAGAGPRGPFPS